MIKLAKPDKNAVKGLLSTNKDGFTPQQQAKKDAEINQVIRRFS
jgi:hypothetical protein